MKTTYATRYHHDGTVTVWDVYRQQWVRLMHPSDAVLASLSTATRERVMRHCGMADDDGFTIDPHGIARDSRGEVVGYDSTGAKS